MKNLPSESWDLYKEPKEISDLKNIIFKNKKSLDVCDSRFKRLEDKIGELEHEWIENIQTEAQR